MGLAQIGSSGNFIPDQKIINRKKFFSQRLQDPCDLLNIQNAFNML